MTRLMFLVSALSAIIGALFRWAWEADTKRIITHSGDGSTSKPLSTLFAHGPLDDVESALIYARHQIAEDMRRRLPGYSTCGRCKLPWPLLTLHSTTYIGDENSGMGCFPLCEDCWAELRTPQNRMPYYMKLVDEWVKDSPNYADEYEGKRALVTEAVLKGA